MFAMSVSFRLDYSRFLRSIRSSPYSSSRIVYINVTGYSDWRYARREGGGGGGGGGGGLHKKSIWKVVEKESTRSSGVIVLGDEVRVDRLCKQVRLERQTPLSGPATADSYRLCVFMLIRQRIEQETRTL